MRIYSLLITLLFSLILASSAFAQSDSFNYSVTYVVSENTPTPLLIEAKNHLEKELINLGGVYNEQEGFLFLIGVSTPSENNEVALSVGVFNKIEEEIVELGKREQAFYSLLESEKNTEFPTKSIAI